MADKNFRALREIKIPNIIQPPHHPDNQQQQQTANFEEDDLTTTKDRKSRRVSFSDVQHVREFQRYLNVDSSSESHDSFFVTSDDMRNASTTELRGPNSATTITLPPTTTITSFATTVVTPSLDIVDGNYTIFGDDERCFQDSNYGSNKVIINYAVSDSTFTNQSHLGAGSMVPGFNETLINNMINMTQKFLYPSSPQHECDQQNINVLSSSTSTITSSPSSYAEHPSRTEMDPPIHRTMMMSDAPENDTKGMDYSSSCMDISESSTLDLKNVREPTMMRDVDEEDARNDDDDDDVIVNNNNNNNNYDDDDDAAIFHKNVSTTSVGPNYCTNANSINNSNDCNTTTFNSFNSTAAASGAAAAAVVITSRSSSSNITMNNRNTCSDFDQVDYFNVLLQRCRNNIDEELNLMMADDDDDDDDEMGDGDVVTMEKVLSLFKNDDNIDDEVESVFILKNINDQSKWRYRSDGSLSLNFHAHSLRACRSRYKNVNPSNDENESESETTTFLGPYCVISNKHQPSLALQKLLETDYKPFNSEVDFLNIVETLKRKKAEIDRTLNQHTTTAAATTNMTSFSTSETIECIVKELGLEFLLNDNNNDDDDIDVWSTLNDLINDKLGDADDDPDSGVWKAMEFKVIRDRCLKSFEDFSDVVVEELDNIPAKKTKRSSRKGSSSLSTSSLSSSSSSPSNMLSLSSPDTLSASSNKRLRDSRSSLLKETESYAGVLQKYVGFSIPTCDVNALYILIGQSAFCHFKFSQSQQSFKCVEALVGLSYKQTFKYMDKQDFLGEDDDEDFEDDEIKLENVKNLLMEHLLADKLAAFEGAAKKCQSLSELFKTVDEMSMLVMETEGHYDFLRSLDKYGVKRIVDFDGTRFSLSFMSYSTPAYKFTIYTDDLRLPLSSSLSSFPLQPTSPTSSVAPKWTIDIKAASFRTKDIMKEILLVPFDHRYLENLYSTVEKWAKAYQQSNK
ncbi:hypothetical protein HELRODRAFT_191130 [Helobdella robusta]|uniref:Uncharacterized protein n=1 Tax=Helobdella robusta TaxID=6412 RepID=T1FSM5_HELRO|nr:hypothetical protein HELRODRAFT_191130 [Helobdella robusta]ESO07304.1 hypothetical protein HELRODRAFT_191130 [Helobdella robusta]